MTDIRQLRRILGIGTLGCGIAVGSAACAKMQAKTVPDGPPLDVPAPPARVIAPAEEPIAAAPTEPLESAPIPTNTTRKPARKPVTPEPQRAEPTATADAPPPQAPPPEPAVTMPAPTLRAPGSAEKPIRDLVVRAQRDLARVDYAKLTEAGKTQYEQSKRFAEQAEQALKDQNIPYAQTLADKAATLAAELLGR